MDLQKDIQSEQSRMSRKLTCSQSANRKTMKYHFRAQATHLKILSNNKGNARTFIYLY